MGKVVEKFKEKFKSDILNSHENLGDETIVVEARNIKQILHYAKESAETQFDLLLDICGVDYVGREPRFEVVYHLYSIPLNHRLRIKVQIPESDCKIPSCVDLWKSADWFERETFDMLGIHFEGHPNLKRLLLFEGFEGHPLRKDYPITQRQKIPEPLENP